MVWAWAVMAVGLPLLTGVVTSLVNDDSFRVALGNLAVMLGFTLVFFQFAALAGLLLPWLGGNIVGMNSEQIEIWGFGLTTVICSISLFFFARKVVR